MGIRCVAKATHWRPRGAPPLAQARTSPQKTLGEVGVAEESGCCRNRFELRPRGAPPPTPPRSFLTERGEFIPRRKSFLSPPDPSPEAGEGSPAVARNEREAGGAEGPRGPRHPFRLSPSRPPSLEPPSPRPSLSPRTTHHPTQRKRKAESACPTSGRTRWTTTAQGRPGKIAVVPTKPASTQRDLSLAYSPGRRRAVPRDRREPRGRLPLHRARQPRRRGLQRHRGARARQHRPARRQAGDGGQGRALQALRRHRRVRPRGRRQGPRRRHPLLRDARAHRRRHQPRGHQRARVLLHRGRAQGAAARSPSSTTTSTAPRSSPAPRCSTRWRSAASRSRRSRSSSRGAGAAAIATAEHYVSLGRAAREHRDDATARASSAPTAATWTRTRAASPPTRDLRTLAEALRGRGRLRRPLRRGRGDARDGRDHGRRRRSSSRSPTRIPRSCRRTCWPCAPTRSWRPGAATIPTRSTTSWASPSSSAARWTCGRAPSTTR